MAHLVARTQAVDAAVVGPTASLRGCLVRLHDQHRGILSRHARLSAGWAVNTAASTVL